MRTILILAAASASIGAAPASKLPTPADIVAAAPASAWKTIPADDLLIIDFASGGRVVVQLAPAFAPVHVSNIRALAHSDYWKGASVYRVQDGYVAQWGLNEETKPLPAGVNAKPAAEYSRPLKGLKITPLGSPDPYAPAAGFADGWPIGYSPKADWATLTHCYGYVGVARDLSPDTGNGAELYAVIGHSPRALDRNIAVVGRVVEGIDRLSSLPRGTGAMGFYKDKGEDVGIASVRLASDLPLADRPSYEYLDSASPVFARYLQLGSHRHDDFFIQPADGIDVCAARVPVRKKKQP